MKNFMNSFKLIDKRSIIGMVVVNAGLLLAMFGANQDGANALVAEAKRQLEEQEA